MCLILVAWRAHPDYPLVVAANRDEFFARPAAEAGWWQDCPSVFAGRDLEAGGTWLGLGRDGRFAGLTNFRDPQRNRDGTPSRGALVADFLRGRESTAEALARLQFEGPRYNAFNLLVSDGDSLGIYESASGSARLLEPGLHALSNHLLDTPWPKVTAGKSRLARALRALPDDTPLCELLRDDRPAPDAELPRTGVSLAWERMLSSAFIRAPGYGTRCSTVVTRDRHGWTHVTESSWDAVGVETGRVVERFQVDRA
ncbi:MAG TPA: NRDE family protein [Zoogloea sp.]|uniref:NRDE family protein n=1 Tax=Zoogloea sp. TaxID=49181 RepID=UPI002BA73530|nr:NRDE family protein [Zoogloea sp.]HOB45472.1 NRDE family protein [Zoogloea sp.]HQA09622.1 NRDE family protein [Zoogloea sp.]HQE41388.1 NRDE family protein [Zoogloea sp.]